MTPEDRRELQEDREYDWRKDGLMDEAYEDWYYKNPEDMTMRDDELYNELNEEVYREEVEEYEDDY